jgi:tetratricopeptide (TPR) repeat protein
MGKDDAFRGTEKTAISKVKRTKKSASQSPGSGQGKAYQWLYVLGLVLGCLLVWYQTVNVPFHFDDIYFVQENLSIRKLENCYGNLKSFFNRGLLQIGYTLNYAISKKLPDGRPLPESFHVVNLLLHLINTLLAFGLARLVMRRAYGTTGGTFAASAVALAFAVLPIHTMTVNLIASRAVMQSATFSLLFLILAFLSLDPLRPLLQRIGLTAGALAALLCSVASKAVGIAAVGLFGLLVYVMGKRVGKISFTRRQLLYLSMSLALCGAVLFGVIRSGAVWQDRYHGVWANLLTQAGVTLQYLKLLIWPVGISIEHHVPVVHALWDPGVVLSVAAVLGLLVIGGWLLLRGSLLGLCILWYFVALAPSSSLIPRTETMLEYRAYLAALGFAGALVWLLHQLQAWLRAFRQGSGRWETAVVLTLGASWVIVMGIVTFQHNKIYTDEVSLWANAVKNAPQKARPHNNLGSALVKKWRFKEAIRHCHEALRINPDFWEAHYDLARALVRLERVEEGISQYYEALQINPEYADAHYNLGRALMLQERFEEAISHYYEALRIKPEMAEAHNNLGIALEKQGQPEEAMTHYFEALRVSPDDAEAHTNLGNALMRKGKIEEAISHYHEALRIKPGLAAAHVGLGTALEKKGRLKEAISHYSEALRIKPDFVEAHTNLGNALMRQEKYEEAMRHYYEALRTNPDYAEAHTNLGIALERQGRLKEAINHYSETLRIKPKSAEAHYNLGGALMRQGKYEEAMRYYYAALQIKPDYVEAHYNLGVALALQGDRKGAASHFSEVMRIDPGNIKARLALEKLTQ